MSGALALKVALGNHAHVLAIKEGRVPIEGVAPEFISVNPMIAAYRRMVRDLEFDISELAPTTYLIARACGAPFTALPVVMTRRFHHAGMWCRPDSKIAHPRDLEGKKVGVRAYSVTAGVWTRGIFVNEFGLNADRVTWVVDDEEHVLALPLPGNVVHAPAGVTLASLAASGELDAGVNAAAGIGTPPAGWRDLVPDAAAQEAAWFKRTGIYPIHSVIVIKDELLKAHRWLAGAVYRAFCAAKAIYLRRLSDDAAAGAEDRRYRELSALVGDPLPYGLKANRPAIETLITYAVEQHLIPSPLKATDVFLDPEEIRA